MNLYLTSYRIPTLSTLEVLLPKPKEECVVGVIRNAKDFRPDVEVQQAKLDALLSDLRDMGLNEIYVIDLHEVDQNFSFEYYDVVYGAGGNTFALNYAVHQGENAVKLKSFINHGGVYIGESAGSIILGKNIKKFNTVDDELSVPEIIEEGLGIIDGIVCPHADSPDYKEEVTKTIQYYEQQGFRTYVLNDNQAYVVQGEKRYIETGVYFGNENRIST